MIEEDHENANEEHGEDTEQDSIDEMVDNAENITAAEETVEVSKNQAVTAAERVDAAEKERRSKKRNERPPPSEEGEKTLPARPAKRTKIMAKRPPKKAAGTPKGNVSEPNTSSNCKAQLKTNPLLAQR
ncbi:hypothetical protein QL285_070166 [Trifolium repens]|nr:hypothetical protein QL285_070166 [Trifolium repens]